MSTAMSVAHYLRVNKNLYGRMHLQKLLYYSQAWALAWTGRPLFQDEIEAWTQGPVVRDVWVNSDIPMDSNPDEALTTNEVALVEAVYAFYGNSSGSVLSDKTHNELPWVEARKGLSDSDRSTNVVSQATMRRYYSGQSIQKTIVVPNRPVLESVHSSDRFERSARRQLARWSGVIDALALR